MDNAVKTQVLSFALSMEEVIHGLVELHIVSLLARGILRVYYVKNGWMQQGL